LNLETPESKAGITSTPPLLPVKEMKKKKKIEDILRSAHTVCLCVLCGSENKQQLFPYTALTDWFV
jgi:hypothetical protein